MSPLRRLARRLLRREGSHGAEELLGPYRGNRVRLEVSSRCQLSCPLCPTATGAARRGSVGWGFLALEDFVRFLARNPAIRHVELSNYGEIFLNPQLAGILEHAHAAGVSVEADNGTNLNHASEEQLEAVVRYGVRRLVVSIDGASQETYGIYRSGGTLSRVLENVRRVNEWKARLGSDRPLLIWQFVVFGHNEHELPVARRLAAELGMVFSPKLNWDRRYSPVRDPEFVRQETGLEALSHAAFAEKTGRRYFLGCRDLWAGPQVNWDGRLLGCCVNFWGDFGNAFTGDLETCTDGEAYRHAKRVLLGLEKPRPGLPCLDCGIYLDEVRHRPLTREDVLEPDMMHRMRDAEVQSPRAPATPQTGRRGAGET